MLQAFPMRAKGGPVEIDQRPLRIPIASMTERGTTAAGRHGRRGLAHRTVGPVPDAVAVLLLVAAFAVAAYGVASSRGSLATAGLVVAAVVSLASAAAGGASRGRLERRNERLGRARAESERARHDLAVENAELRRHVASLQAQRTAIVDGFDWIDEHTAGRLRALLDESGLQLANLADTVLDDDREDA